MMKCQTCDAIVPEPGMYCSATDTLVCQGRDHIPPCGEPLTADERHWYGTTCEKCEVEWALRIEAWRKGAPDSELDRMFDIPMTLN